MSLRISSRTIDPELHIIDPEGEVDMYTSPLLREALMDAFENGAKQVVMNLRKVDYLDSTGLGILVGGMKRMRDGGGTLRLCEASPRVNRLLHLTDLDTIIDIYPTEREAVSASTA